MKIYDNTIKISNFTDIVQYKQANRYKHVLRHNVIDCTCIDYPFKCYCAMQYYSGGVFDSSRCSSNKGSLTHSMLVTGYGTSNGKDYWLVKNRYEYI